jgi:WXG100 family type VII secretion target
MNVTYAEMNSAAQRLTAGENTIDSELGNLKSLIDELVSSGFVTDSASGAFHGAYEQFTTGARQVISGLTQMSTYLNKAAQTIEETDQALARAIQA